MCLVAFALDAHHRHRLVLVGNRDEATDRPASPLARWADAPHVVAGRDRVAGGTWLGVTDAGRWAVLTNVRDPLNPRPATRSRGTLAADFLRGSDSVEDYAQTVFASRAAYDGFNLMVGDGTEARAVSTRTSAITALEPGVYGLSNDQLNTPWPKLTRARSGLRAALDADPVPLAALVDLLDDTTEAPDSALPDTGVGLELERVLSAARVVTPGYGTRVTTALVLDRDGTGVVAEKTWNADGTAGATVRLEVGVELKSSLGSLEESPLHPLGGEG